MIVAGEQLGRRAYAMELEPAWCDVAVQRWGAHRRKGEAQALMPQPSKLTPELHAKVVRAVDASNYRETAAQHAGIDRKTFYRWMERGEQAAEELERVAGLTRSALAAECRERKFTVRAKATSKELVTKLTAREEPYLAFREAVNQALAQAQVRDIAIIEKAATTQWQAAAWRLERMFPELFGQRSRHEVTGAGGGPLDVRLTHVTDDQLAAAITRLEAHDQV